MQVSPPQLKNVVIQLRVSLNDELALRLANLREEKEQQCKRRKLNFFNFKEEGFAFTVFPSSGDVIITGLKEVVKIYNALRCLSYLIHVPYHMMVQTPWKITNSTYSGTVKTQEGNTSVCQTLARYKENLCGNGEDVNVSFRSQFFPGARVRFSKLGTVNLFNNGKYVFVGVKTPEDAEALRDKLCVIMQTS